MSRLWWQLENHAVVAQSIENTGLMTGWQQNRCCHLLCLKYPRWQLKLSCVSAVTCHHLLRPKGLNGDSSFSELSPGFSCHHLLSKKKKPALTGFFFGGDKRDRTADLLNAIQALSQLPSPLRGCGWKRLCCNGFRICIFLHRLYFGHLDRLNALQI